MDTNNQLNEVFPSFDRFHKELSPDFQLVDNFPNNFSFHTVNYKDKEVMNIHLYTLNKILNDFLLNSSIVLVISNTSIKNNITTSILHICFNKNIIAKTHYHIINVTFTKVELFLIRYKINQAIEVSNAKNITIIIDVIYTARHIFNSSFYSYQLHFIAIFQDLRTFFNKSSNNSIVFWNCFSSTKCPLDLAVDKETKKFKMNLTTPCKLSWDFSKKEECDLILCN